MAYVGSPRRNSVGGICTPEYFKNGYTLYLNSGLSSSRNHYGQRVITREADLVTAHEFGHNWGSEHVSNAILLKLGLIKNSFRTRIFPNVRRVHRKAAASSCIRIVCRAMTSTTKSFLPAPCDRFERCCKPSRDGAFPSQRSHFVVICV